MQQRSKYPDFKVPILKIYMKSNPIFDTLYGLHIFINSHFMYLYSVITSLYSSFHVTGGARLSQVGFKLHTHAPGIHRK